MLRNYYLVFVGGAMVTLEKVDVIRYSAGKSTAP
jgi:hypothetical protein